MVYLPFLAGELLTADKLNTRIIEETMAWTAIDDIGTFSANGSASSQVPRMRKLMVMDTEVWQFEGKIATTGITANTTTTLFTFDAGYRPAAEEGWSAYAAGTAHYSARLGLTSAGLLTVSVPTAAGNAMTFVWLTGKFITNPV